MRNRQFPGSQVALYAGAGVLCEKERTKSIFLLVASPILAPRQPIPAACVQLNQLSGTTLQMRNFTYWLCFGLVAVANIISLVLTLMHVAGIAQPSLQFLSLFMAFRSLVPEMLAFYVPSILALPLFFVMIALVARRLWLFSLRGERVPHSYTGLQQGLGYLGALSVILTALALVLTMVLRAGSGVPAGLLLIPAAFCIPWAFFLTEVFSFRKPKAQSPALP